MKSLLGIPLLALALSAQASTVIQDFTGDFDPSLWASVTSAGGSAGFSGKIEAEMYGSDDDSGIPASQELVISMVQGGQLIFDWQYVTKDNSATRDPFGVRINGIFYPVVDLSLGSSSQYGTASFTLSAKDVFAFALLSTDSTNGQSWAGVSAFSFVPSGNDNSVSEPSIWALLALACAGQRWCLKSSIAQRKGVA